MSKSRPVKCGPPCCPGNSSDSTGVAVIGLIVLAVAIYGIIRAIWHVVIEIIEITAIAAGSIGALILLIVVAEHVIRWRHHTRSAAHPQIITSDPASLPVTSPAIAPAKPAPDPAELFAEAVATGMDRRFIEKILNTAMQRPGQ